MLKFLDELYLFVWKSRGNSTARALRLTQPTIGRHLAQLEKALGAPLFSRSPQGMLPTETALALLPFAEAMESAAHAIARTASAAGEVAGVVRVTASEVIGAEVLPAILSSFAAAHPRIAFELVLSNRTENLLRRDADIAVRMVRPEQEGLVARRLGETVLGLHASLLYLSAHPAPQTVADLARHRLIGFDRAPVRIKARRLWHRSVPVGGGAPRPAAGAPVARGPGGALGDVAGHA